MKLQAAQRLSVSAVHQLIEPDCEVRPFKHPDRYLKQVTKPT
jgi:hypothetical protein